MKHKLFILCVLSMSLPVMLTAQSLTNSERRHINTQVLNIVEDYETYSSLYDTDAEFYFEELFSRVGKLSITCDMIGSELYLKRITVPEYISQLRSNSVTTSVFIRDVSRGEMQVDGKKVLIPVTFRKNLSYIDKEGYIFSVSGYHSDDFLVRMNISYDRDKDICLIESIDAKLQSGRTFPVGRFLIVSRNHNPDKKYLKYLPQLTIGGNRIEYDERGQAILPKGNPELRDPDVEILVDTLTKGFNYDVIDLSFKPRSKRVKFRYGIAPISAYKVDNPYDNVSDKSMAMELGADFGFTWPIGNSSKMGFYFGAGLAISSLSLSLDNPVEYDYAMTVYNSDKKLFEDKTMKYVISGASEKVRYYDFMIPVYFEFEHSLSRQVLLSWNVGVKGYLPLDVQVCGPYAVTATADGNTVEFAEPMKYVEANTYVKDNKFDMSLMGNVGVDVNVHKNRIYCTVLLGYEHGLMSPVYSSHKNIYYSPTSGDGGVYPIVYNPRTEEHVPVHSLISGVSFNRSAFWVSAGLKIKM